jgi:hypothetical protein
MSEQANTYEQAKYTLSDGRKVNVERLDLPFHSLEIKRHSTADEYRDEWIKLGYIVDPRDMRKIVREHYPEVISLILCVEYGIDGLEYGDVLAIEVKPQKALKILTSPPWNPKLQFEEDLRRQRNCSSSGMS